MVIASDLLNVLNMLPAYHNGGDFAGHRGGCGRVVGPVLRSVAYLVGFVDLEIILGPGKPLDPDFLFLLMHILPVWRPLSGRKTSSFLKLHGDLLLPKVSFHCSAPIIVGLFPSWNPLFSVPPFPLVPSVRPALFLRRVCTPLLHLVLIGCLRHVTGR